MGRPDVLVRYTRVQSTYTAGNSSYLAPQPPGRRAICSRIWPVQDRKPSATMTACFKDSVCLLRRGFAALGVEPERLERPLASSPSRAQSTTAVGEHNDTRRRRHAVLTTF